MLYRRNRASVAQTTQNQKCDELASARSSYRDRPRRPSPRVFAMRHANAQRGRADAHVTVKDVPAFVGGIEIAAAGRRGDAAIKARPGRAGNLRGRSPSDPAQRAISFRSGTCPNANS